MLVGEGSPADCEWFKHHMAARVTAKGQQPVTSVPESPPDISGYTANLAAMDHSPHLFSPQMNSRLIRPLIMYVGTQFHCHYHCKYILLTPALRELNKGKWHLEHQAGPEDGIVC